MPQPHYHQHLLLLGAGATVACCAVLWHHYTRRRSGTSLVQSAQRWLSRNAPVWRALVAAGSSAEQQPVLEPGEGPWPAAGFPGPPRCRPISTVTELLTWQPPQPAATAAAAASPTLTSSSSSGDGVDPCVCSTPLLLREPSPPHRQHSAHTSVAPAATDSTSGSGSGSSSSSGTADRPQLLVCHDMRGGYLDYESLLAGSPDAAEYRLWHWDCVDCFVYFSHHMVTIPPKGWIHAAHKHGVKVLGTFITEFGQGRLRCDRLFSCNETARRVADQLVAIAQHYGFEGWLVNIENHLSASQVAALQHFVGYLRARTRDTCAHGMVVWYDAVTTAGQLRWQNGLTPLNAPFFDLADALFVNYTWTPPQLPPTTAAAGRRAPSVYMGVDVFGRGSYGGGGFGVGKALTAARAAGLSAALFAPGWVHENLDQGRFHELQDKWWGQVQRAWGQAHPLITQMPFSSTFNPGAGWAVFRAGVPDTHNTLAAAAAAAAAATAAGGGGTTAASAADGAGVGAASGGGENASTAGGVNGGSWYNLCETEVLPCVRDPLTQQVVSGPVGGVLSGSTAFEGAACLALYQTHTQVLPQQHQQQKQAGAGVANPPGTGTGSSGPAAPDIAAATTASNPDGGSSGDQPTCCCLLVTLPGCAAGTSSSSSSGSGGRQQQQQQFALLQLFTACVPIKGGSAMRLSCVYAAPGSGKAFPAAAAAALTSSGTSTPDSGPGVSTTAVAAAAPAASPPPVLWIMTEAAAVAAGESSEGGAARVLYLPAPQASSSSSTAPAPSSSRVVTASKEAAGLELVLVPVAAALVDAPAPTAAAGAECRVQLVPHPVPAAAAAAGAASEIAAEVDGSSGSSSSSGSPPSWMTPLPAAVGGWSWRQQAWSVTFPADAVITGVGVAVAVGPGQGAVWSEGGPGSAGGKVDVLALLGKVQLSLV